MTLNIIHLPHRTDRLQLLKNQLQKQKISDYKIWNGIIDIETPATGISKAHKQVVQYAKENNLPEVLIAEDDLYFTADTSLIFFLSNKPFDYDIYLSSTYHGLIKGDNTIKDFSGLTFYMVSQRFYNTFLTASENMNLDRALRKKGKYIVCNPFTVIQRNGYSDNVKKFCNYDQLLKGRNIFQNNEYQLFEKIGKF